MLVQNRLKRLKPSQLEEQNAKFHAFYMRGVNLIITKLSQGKPFVSVFDKYTYL